MTRRPVVHARRALLATGWASDVKFTIADGRFEKIEPGMAAAKADRRVGTVVPGIPNLHSHAFQRILAGMSELRDGSADAFMSWRSTMYSCLEKLTPELFGDLCAYIYARMLRFGYTNVAEFHYVHRDQAGGKYANPAELSLRVVAAARKAGIGITHLPVVYEHGGFERRPLSAQQARLQCSIDDAHTIAEAVKAEFAGDETVGLGIAPHSLRAVDHKSIRATAGMADSISPTAPLHIHVSEQRAEVEQCIATYGKNPIELLASSTDLDPRWVLVHCTHARLRDFRTIAAAGATVALCPATEANLGDGHVNLTSLLSSKAHFGIGSDSQIVLDPKTEWQTLEFSQRLRERKRNVASRGGLSVGRTLVQAGSASAERAFGRAVGKLEAGYQADLVELDIDDPAFAGLEGDRVLDAWILAADAPVVANVMVAGDWVVTQGVHREEEALRQRYLTALRQVRA